MAAEGKIDPMHQFVIEPIAGSFQHGNPFVFTNSALWTLIVLGDDLGVHVRRDEARADSGPLASHGRRADRLRRRHGERQHRARRQEVSAVGFHRLRLPSVRQPHRATCPSVSPAAHPFTVTSQFTFTGVHVDHHLRDRARGRLLEARASFLLAVRAEGCSARLQVRRSRRSSS